MPLSAAHKFPALHKPTARGIFPIFLSLSGTVSECESGEITSSSRPWQGGNENEMNPAASLLCPSAVTVNVTGSRLSIGKKKQKNFWSSAYHDGIRRRTGQNKYNPGFSLWSPHDNPNQPQKTELRDSPPYTHIQIEPSYFNKTIQASETFFEGQVGPAWRSHWKGRFIRDRVNLMHNFIGGEGGVKLQDRKSQRKILERLYVTPSTRRRTKNTGISPRRARARRWDVWPKSRCLLFCKYPIIPQGGRAVSQCQESANWTDTRRPSSTPLLDTLPAHWLGQQHFK